MGSNPTPRTELTTHLVSKIVNVLLHLRRQGYREPTLLGFSRRLRHLASHTDLDNPERVKEFVASKNCSEGFKGNLINAYQHYADFHRLEFQKPHYSRVDRFSKVPRREDINKIIAHARPRYALAYSILRDTGLRPIELTWLRLKQIDLENRRLYPGTAKHGSARTLTIRPSTLAMLKKYVHHKRISPETRIWPSRKRLTSNWSRLSNSVAMKLGEPQLAQIRLYDLRHHYATMLYAKTKDIVHVQRQLGHKTLQHTLRYVGLVDIDAEEYVVKVAVDVEESSRLLEAAFEFVAVIEGRYVFRKPKKPLFFLGEIWFM